MEIFKILNDNYKLKIIVILLEEELCVCDLEKIINIKQNLLSNKLKVLRDNKIVNIRKDKNWHYYSINKKFIEENKKLIEYIQEKNITNPIKKSFCKEKNEEN